VIVYKVFAEVIDNGPHSDKHQVVFPEIAGEIFNE
jgi:hypothetical protein